MRRYLLLATLIAAVLPVMIAAQKPVTPAAPAFDVVSVKPNRSNQGIPLVIFQPGGRMVAGNTTPRELILVAYGLEDIQLVGAPDWTAMERFAVEARTSAGTSTDAIRLMLRAMLADRFGLTVHPERRDLPMYALITTRSDRRLGPAIRASGSECAPITPPAGVPAPPPPPPPPAGGPIRIILPTDEPLQRRCGAMIAPGWISLRTFTMKEFAVPLTQLLRRPVVDETGLTGAFDLDLTYAPDQGPTGPPGVGSVVAGGPPGGPGLAWTTDRPSLSTVLQEDLGLKLDSRRGPVDVLVVDRIARPTEN